MAESYQRRLATLISRLDSDAQLRLRRALVRQALTYAEAVLHGKPEGDEGDCLRAAALWLEQPDSLDSTRAINAALERELAMIMELDRPMCWHVVRTTRVPLVEAAQRAADVAAQAGGWLNPAAARVDRERGPRVAAQAARALAVRWQVNAARAILEARKPPPLPALPEPLDDPAQIFVAFRREFNPQDAYRRDELHELRLHLTVGQVHELARLERVQAARCVRALRLPLIENRGERASLSQAYAALIKAHVGRRQTNRAEAVAATALWPTEASDPGPLSGRLAEYRSGELQRLCARLDQDGLRRLKLALVQQALWYAAGVLPNASEDQGHRSCLAAVQLWLDGSHAEPVADLLGPLRAGAPLARALVWNAVRYVALAAGASDADTLLRNVDTVVTAATAARATTIATSAEAEAAAYLARDYQLAAAARISAGEEPPFWTGPARLYSEGSIDTAIRRMGEARQGLLRLALLADCCLWVRRGLEAYQASSPRVSLSRQLVDAVQAWTAQADIVVHGAQLVQDDGVRAAAYAALEPVDNMVSELRIAVGLATRPASTPAQTSHATSLIVEYCRRAACFAALARARRWELDAAYAILCGAEPPPLELPTGA